MDKIKPIAPGSAKEQPKVAANTNATTRTTRGIAINTNATTRTTRGISLNTNATLRVSG